MDCLKLVDLFSDSVGNLVNEVRASGNSLEIGVQDCFEVFANDADFFQVLANVDHMLWSKENVLHSLEVPTCDGALSFDVHLSFVELVVPFLEDCNCLVDLSDSSHGLGLEDGPDVDFVANLLANFV